MLLKMWFHGNRRGAIGISYEHVLVAEVADAQEPVLKAYETHDHISGFVVRAAPDGAVPGCSCAAPRLSGDSS